MGAPSDASVARPRPNGPGASGRTLPLSDLFREAGTRSVVGGNEPFLLDGGDAVWAVLTGTLNVFTVRTEEGRPAGRRHHLLRLGEGEAAWEVDHGPGTTVGLLAVPSAGTELARLPRARIRECVENGSNRAEAASLVERWVLALTAALESGSSPELLEPLPSGETSTLTAGEAAGPEGEIVWVRHRSGSSRFLGRETLPDREFLPLARGSWLEAAEASELEAVATDTFLSLDPEWRGFGVFHGTVLDHLEGELDALERAERKRMSERARADRAAFRGAVARLTDVLEPSALPGGEADPHEDPVLRAARIVGDAEGITVEAPSDPEEAPASVGARLEEVSRASGFRVRQVVLRGRWWERDHGPMVGSIEDDRRPVALLPVSPSRYEMVDPADGSRVPVTPEVADDLSPFAHVLHRPLPNREVGGMDLLRLGLEGCGRDLWTILLMGIAGGLLGLVTPVATGYLVDTVIPGSRRVELVHLTLALVAVAVSIAVFKVVRSIALLRVGSRANMTVQAAIWDRLLRLQPSFFRGFTAGDLANRALGVNQIRQVLSGVVASTLVGGIFGVFHFALLFYYSWKLALLAVVLSGVLLVVTGAIGLYSLRFQRRLADLEGVVSGMVLQFITGLPKLRVAGAEERAFAEWAERFGRKKQTAFRAGAIENWLQTVKAVFPVLSTMAVFWLALSLIEGAEGAAALTTGDFLAFNASFGTFLSTALSMVLAGLTALAVLPVFQRSVPILEALPEATEDGKDPGRLSGEVEVSRVSFRYLDEGPTVLDEVSLHIPAGGYVALVGPSGSGKSTLLRLLLGFERPSVGSVYYDGQDLEELDVTEVRRQIGVVLQSGRLRAGSFYDNIVGSSSLDMDDAWEAARMAGLADDIEAMPMGMQTHIDAAGATLSGGQKQRLMIARAIVFRPRLLFLDEATSALDNRTQSIVAESLDRLQATRIVVAHRLSTVIHAHRIHVMDSGRIVDAGTYDELMAREGLFRTLAERQIA